MSSSFAFLLQEGAVGVRRGLFHSSVAAAALALAICALSLYYYGRLNLQKAAAGLLGQFQIEAFVSYSLPDDQHPGLEQKLRDLDRRWQITYVSRPEAAARFAREFDPQLFDVLKDNPLPASFLINIPPPSLRPDSAKALADRIRRIEGIEDVVYDQELLALLQGARQNLAHWGLVAGSVALLLAIGLTYNAVRLKIDNQREAISLMSLLGATPATLRGIYWVQGVILGALGGCVGAILLSVLIRSLQPRLAADFGLIAPPAVLLIVAGMALGIIGSVLAVGRYLRV